jgi:phospholipid/cholesterol/gamma-HCH transport system substrate-binding protein
MRRRRQTSRRRLVLGIAVLVVLAATAVISTIAINGVPWSNPYTVQAVVPASAPIVRPGDEVRVAGQRVGVVREVEPSDDGRVVRFELDDGEVGRDASATVRLRGLAGAVFIDLDPGDSADPAPSGWTIPRGSTSSGTQLTDVVAAFDAQTRHGLGRTLSVTGAGLAGRGEELSHTLGDLRPTLAAGTPLLEALDPSPGELSGLVAAADRTLAAAGATPGALGGLLTAGRTVLEATAVEREPLGATIDAAPGALDELDATTSVALPLLDDLERTTRALTPTAAELERALPAIDDLLGRDQEIGSAERIASAAAPLVALARPVIEGFDPAARTLGPLVDAGEPLAAYVSRYPDEVFAGPHGFTTWGKFLYDQGQAGGHRAVRFTPVFTCAPGRDPYPAPGQVGEDRMPCF